MVLYVQVAVLKACGRMDMLRMSILTTLLLDDAIVDLLQKRGETLNFANFRVLNKNMMVNINRRFYHTLPLMVTASSMLLDAGFMVIKGGEMITSIDAAEPAFAELEGVEGRAAKRINSAIPRMLTICADVSTKRMVKMLNIEV